MNNNRDIKPQNPTLTNQMPLDRPVPDRPFRLYYALTNHCNRSCPWCCTYSSPEGRTFLSLNDYLKYFPKQGAFEVQLEGGEPSLHPDYPEMIRLAREHPRCTHIIWVTNGVKLPRRVEAVEDFLAQFGERFTIKLSINHYLLERDQHLFEKALLLKQVIQDRFPGGLMVLNLRLRRKEDDENQRILASLKKHQLEQDANVFYLQRYGLASTETEWETPFIVGDHFSLINPDGSEQGTNLIARSESMGALS